MLQVSVFQDIEDLGSLESTQELELVLAALQATLNMPLWCSPNFSRVNCPRRDFAQKAKSRGGTLVTRVYIKESTYS